MSECVHCVNRRIFYKHLDCRSSGCECSSYDRLTARIARQDKHIRTLETQLARLVDWLETLDGHPLPNHIETILREARNG